MKLHFQIAVLGSILTPPALGALQESLAPESKTLAVRVETFSEVLEGGSGGMEFDAQGFVYCADFGSKLGPGSAGGNRIYKLDPSSGEASVFIEDLGGASGNAIGPGGNFIQSNIRNSSIRRIHPDGTSSVFLNKNLRNPVGIAIDPDGEPKVLASDPLLSCPNGIAFDDEQNLYVANFNNGDVIRVSWDGEVSKLTTLPGKNNGHLAYRAGHLYVVARGAHQIYKVSLDGKLELFAGSGARGHDDGPALEATFSFPNDLAFSPDEKFLYVNENASTTEPHTTLAPMLVRRVRLGD
ncbi:MAG: sugar lactone lactonase YvrE [Chlamydiales bacterium]|jgi:sugar lactone lactonase YvrE